MPDVLAFQVQHYRIQTPVYQGPLDLLLRLIERAELDITKIALAQITDQYLAYLQQMDEHSPEEVSAFLVIAAKLVQIKSEALLPRPPVREEGEEDPGETLVRQLREYRRFKRVAAWLQARRDAGWQSFLRLAAPPRIEKPSMVEGVTLEDLRQAAQRAFALRPQQPLGTVIAPPKVTIREKIHAILQTLHRRGKATFSALLGGRRTRLETIVTFLALLELVKQRIVSAQQDTLFGEIEITPLQDALPPSAEIASEFGE